MVVPVLLALFASLTWTTTRTINNSIDKGVNSIGEKVDVSFDAIFNLLYGGLTIGKQSEIISKRIETLDAATNMRESKKYVDYAVAKTHNLKKDLLITPNPTIEDNLVVVDQIYTLFTSSMHIKTSETENTNLVSNKLYDSNEYKQIHTIHKEIQNYNKRYNKKSLIDKSESLKVLKSMLKQVNAGEESYVREGQSTVVLEINDDEREERIKFLINHLQEDSNDNEDDLFGVVDHIERAPMGFMRGSNEILYTVYKDIKLRSEMESHMNSITNNFFNSSIDLFNKILDLAEKRVGDASIDTQILNAFLVVRILSVLSFGYAVYSMTRSVCGRFDTWMNPPIQQITMADLERIGLSKTGLTNATTNSSIINEHNVTPPANAKVPVGEILTLPAAASSNQNNKKQNNINNISDKSADASFGGKLRRKSRKGKSRKGIKTNKKQKRKGIKTNKKQKRKVKTRK